MTENICNKCANQNNCKYEKGSHICFEPKRENAESTGLTMVKKMIAYYEKAHRSDTNDR